MNRRLRRLALGLALVAGACTGRSTSPGPTVSPLGSSGDASDPSTTRARGARRNEAWVPPGHVSLRRYIAELAEVPHEEEPPSDTPPIPSVGTPTQARFKCGKPGTRGLAGSTVPVLADHLRLRVPKGTGSEPMPWDIMSAPETDAEQTRLMLGDGQAEQTLVIIANELWQTEPNDLPHHLRGMLTARLGERLGTFELVELAAKDVRVFAARPASVNMVGDAALVLATVVIHPDGMLQTVDYYVNDRLLRAGSECTAFAEAMAATITTGKRAMKLKATTHVISPPGGPRLELDVPAGYTVTDQTAHDFVKTRIRRVSPLGEFPGQLTLMTGFHMDPSPPTCDKDCTTPLAHQATILGKSVVWRGGNHGRGGVLGQTIAITRGRMPVEMLMSAWASLDPAHLLELVAIAETLRKVSH